MAIIPGFFKTKKYRKTDSGYKLQSDWTSSKTVEMADGNTLEAKLGKIKGITTSTNVTEEGYAADATTIAALKPPKYNSGCSLGLHMVAVDGSGYVSATKDVSKEDITALGIPAIDVHTGSLFLSTKNIPNDISSSVAAITLEKGHKYLLLGTASFGTNSTGIRAIGFCDKSNTSGMSDFNRYATLCPATVKGNNLQTFSIVDATSEEKTLYLNVYQNSGSSLNCYPGYSVISIS